MTTNDSNHQRQRHRQRTLLRNELPSTSRFIVSRAEEVFDVDDDDEDEEDGGHSLNEESSENEEESNDSVVVEEGAVTLDIPKLKRCSNYQLGGDDESSLNSSRSSADGDGKEGHSPSQRVRKRKKRKLTH